MAKDDSAEVEKIREAVHFYLDGAINQDYEVIFKGWHPEGKMMALNEDHSLKIYDRSVWKDRYERATKDPNMKRTSKILALDYHGGVANVKVQTRVQRPSETIIWVDFLNLMKIKGRWQIVNKIYNEEKYTQ